MPKKKLKAPQAALLNNTQHKHQQHITMTQTAYIPERKNAATSKTENQSRPPATEKHILKITLKMFVIFGNW